MFPLGRFHEAGGAAGEMSGACTPSCRITMSTCPVSTILNPGTKSNPKIEAPQKNPEAPRPCPVLRRRKKEAVQKEMKPNRCLRSLLTAVADRDRRWIQTSSVQHATLSALDRHWSIARNLQDPLICRRLALSYPSVGADHRRFPVNAPGLN